MPQLRGRVAANAMLADITWFRVGGPAQVLFTPADEADLAYFLAQLAARDPGLRDRARLQPAGARRRRAGRGHPLGPRLLADRRSSPDIACAPAPPCPTPSSRARPPMPGIAGLAFYRGVPGSVGGALRMNAGAHGRETKDVLVEASAVDRQGKLHVLSLADMELTYRHCGVPDDWIFTRRCSRAAPASRPRSCKQMEEVAEYREANQPIKERTGGSTFKNPPGSSAWKLIDAGRLPRLTHRRRQGVRDALQLPDQRPQRHGRGHRAAGRDRARARQSETSGVTLQWEIIRLGAAADGQPTGEALVEALAQ